jgi:hypothetical protein
VLESFGHLTWLCDIDHAQQLVAAAAPAAARMSMLLLRSVSAAIQLYDPLSPAAFPRIRELLRCAYAVKQHHRVMLNWDMEELVPDQSVQDDVHVYQHVPFVVLQNLTRQ